MFRYVLFLLFFFTSIANAQLTNVGRAPFAAPKPDFPCKAFMTAMERLPEWHIAFLFNTFGTDYSCINAMIADSRLKSLEIHLINEACHRNKRCGSYEFLYNYKSVDAYNIAWEKKNPSLIRAYKKYVRPMQKMVGTLSQETQCYISGGLESNLKNRAARNMIAVTRELFPTCKIVWNPLKQSNSSVTLPRNGADVIEGHGANPGVSAPCITNLDGTDIDFPDRPSFDRKNNVDAGQELQKHIQKFANKCELAFLWISEDNCNYHSSFIDPRKRSCKLKNRQIFNHVVDEMLAASDSFAKMMKGILTVWFVKSPLFPAKP